MIKTINGWRALFALMIVVFHVGATSFEEMTWAGVTEAQLEEKGVISTSFGEDLSWEYLSYVREHPFRWNVPTRILYGSRDSMTAYETIAAFANAHGAALTVMEKGEHSFNTEEQMRFLDQWIRQEFKPDRAK